MAQALRSLELDRTEDRIEDRRVHLHTVRGRHVNDDRAFTYRGPKLALVETPDMGDRRSYGDGQRRERVLNRGGVCSSGHEKRFHSKVSIRMKGSSIALVVVATVAVVTLALPIKGLGATPPVQRATRGSNPALPSVAMPGQGSVYTVRPGDTLRSIARRLDPGSPSVAFVRLENQIGSNVVVPGEHIELP
ncbi:MAG: LysM peptidoglycan-binding domain-containing protein [Acidimicrobiales bacterium]